MTGLIERILRPGRSSAHEIRLDILWLLGLALLLMAVGLGLRDPWPADEPRFALIARDMVARGEWLIPQVGGDIYGDKPPFFFWLIGLFLLLTGSLRLAFLLPSLLAGLGCVVLVYDLARRLWNRETGMAAGLALLATVQFVWQARQAQIDAMLCFWTTLSLYGLLRHLLLGPDWRWYVAAWAAAGFGIITKGVGFLPLLVFVPYLLARGPGWQARPALNGGWRWLLGPPALAAAAAVWLVPMLLAAQSSPELAAYRDEILFKQTVDRYAEAWHHREPFWYFFVNVIPILWLPLTVLIPWLAPHWRESWRQRDLRVLLPLVWALLVVLFFSLSSGKRGVYVLPAVPGFVLACAPFLADVARRRGPQRAMFGVATAIAVVTIAAAIYLLATGEQRQKLIDSYEIDAVAPLFAIGIGSAIACALARVQRGFAAYGGTLLVTLAIVGLWVYPAMNEARSAKGFVARIEALSAGIEQLGIVAYKEQYLLHLQRPIVNFGHARWRELEQEAADAAVWLVADPQRVLLVDKRVQAMCFAEARARPVSTANRQEWYLVSGAADPDCVARGHAQAARQYRPGGQVR